MPKSFRQTLTILVSLVLASAVLAGSGRAAVTDDEVQRAIQRGKEYLISLQQPNGSFGEGKHGYGESCLIFMTLAYMGMHPNHPVMSKAVDFHLNLNPDTDMGGRQGYALPMRVMGLSYVHNKFLESGSQRGIVRRKMYEDITRFKIGQATNGGWRYKLEPTDNWDFSVTQWPILAMREANIVGIEVPPEPLFRARELYYEKQNDDGGWDYQNGQSRGAMTAAGMASLQIIADILEPGSGCPCQGGRSRQSKSSSERRIDRALEWLSRNFQADSPPHGGHADTLYWLYCVERVGIAAGYKYFGQHNWYAAGAEYIVRKQGGNGSWSGKWGNQVGTCFALLFLYKGRGAVLFNKVRFDGEWNNHRRDINNLVRYIERDQERPFHWQIVELRAPLEELHEAPILYITAETVPAWGDAEKQKLRAFTDTGGTILFEASCGNPPVKRWFQDFAREVWPEWRLKPLGPDHGSYTDPWPLTRRPEVLGIHDGMRTAVFFALDDISCPWHTSALASRLYMFQWGINLLRYATDRAELHKMRAKLSVREDLASTKFASPVNPGPKSSVRIARVRHDGNWEVNANYGGLRKLVDAIRERAAVRLEVTEPNRKPFTEGGVAPADLAGYDAAYITGSRAFAFGPAEQQALKGYVDGGGFLWFEAAGGSPEFDRSLQKLAGDMRWQVKLLPTTHPLVTGRMGQALGYNLSADVDFRKALRFIRAARHYAEFMGVYENDRLIGVYSPLDVAFSATPYEAYKCKGYRPPDARAVATNVVLFLTTRGS